MDEQIDTQRIVIFSGGTLDVWALDEIQPHDLLVGADRGALFLIAHGFRPHIVLGDFDSVTPSQLDDIRQQSETVQMVDAIEKDWTDTEMAFNWALDQRPAEIVMVGAFGTRLDHSLANIHLLRKGLQLGVRCKIVDAHNEVCLINRHVRVAKKQFTYCSLLPLSMEVSGVTLKGFQYPLQQARLSIGQSLGVSNVIVEAYGDVYVEDGLLLVILSKD